MAKKRCSQPSDSETSTPQSIQPQKKHRRRSSKHSSVKTEGHVYDVLSDENNEPLQNVQPVSTQNSEKEASAANSGSLQSLRFEGLPDSKQIVHTIDREISKEELEDDDVELWLCKIPADMDIDKLNGQVINLNGSVDIGQAKHTKYSKSTELIFARAPQNEHSSSLTLLTVGQSDGQIHPVCKGFHGLLTVREFPIPEPYTVPQIGTKQKKDIPKGLKQRYIPFGSDIPFFVSPKQKKMKKHRDS